MKSFTAIFFLNFVLPNPKCMRDIQKMSSHRSVKGGKLTIVRDTNHQVAVDPRLVINIVVMNERNSLRDFTLLDCFHFAFTTWKNFFLAIIVIVTVA